MVLGSVLLPLALAASPLRSPLPIAARELPAGATRIAAPSTEPMYLAITLQMQDRAGLEQLLADQQNPDSPQYRHFLTPDAFGVRFGWPTSRYQALLTYLTQNGLKPTSYPNHLFVRVLGSVGQVEKLLGVALYDSLQDKKRFFTYSGTPTLPASLAEMVEAVGGLDTRFHPRHRVLDSQGTQSVGPSDFRAFYDMTSIQQAGTTGKTAQCAMLGTYPDPSVAFQASDITTFYSTYSNASTQLKQDATQPANQNDYDTQQGLDVEESMDAELPTVAAPGLSTETMVLVGASELFSTGIQQAVNNHPTINSVSVSFGGCEGDVQQSDATAADDAFAQGAAEGQAWFIAAGDNGVAGCAGSDMSYSASAGFPSDSPHVVSVGGTMYTGSFDSNNAITAWGDETTWNETIQGQQVGGGGGASTLFPHPSWQTGPGTQAGNGREQPDLAMLANVTPGIAINVSSQGGYVGIGNGTSAATPLTAGIFALIADRGGSGCMLGLPNSNLYQLGTKQAGGGTAPFHDITTGNISVDGTTGPSAGPGYDEATGWGSIDVSQMVAAYPTCGTTPATTSTAAATTSSTSGGSGHPVVTTATTTSGSGSGSGTTGTAATGASGNAAATATATATSSSGSGTTGTTPPTTTSTSTSSGSGTPGSLPAVPTGDVCAACAIAGDCPHQGEQCVILGTGGYCAPPCTDTSQCGTDNSCTSMTDPSGAVVHACFPTSGMCANSLTSVPTSDICLGCMAPSDCPHRGEQCVFENTSDLGYCAPACTENAQCGSGNLCTPMTDDSGNHVTACYPASETCEPGGSGGSSTKGKGGCASAPGSTWTLALLATLGLGYRRRRSYCRP